MQIEYQTFRMAKIYSVLVFTASIIFHLGNAVSLQRAPMAAAEITFSVEGVDTSFVEDQPNLNLDAVIQVCDAGVWIVYSGQNYGAGEDGVVEIFSQLEPSCQIPLSPRVGSARHAGLTADYASPSATLYADVSFHGEQSGFLADGGLELINFNVNSLVTISTRIEFFQDENYGGDSFCLELTNCNGEVCFTRSLAEEGDFPFDVTLAKSARGGCSDGSKVLSL